MKHLFWNASSVSAKTEETIRKAASFVPPSKHQGWCREGEGKGRKTRVLVPEMETGSHGV